MITEAIDQFLKRGGKIHRVPGFTGAKPLPERREAKKKAAKRINPKMPAVNPPGWYTRDEIAAEAGCSLKLVRQLLLSGDIPEPCLPMGFHRPAVWSPEAAQPIIEMLKNRMAGQTERVKQRRAENFTRKTRNRAELRKDWSELDGK